MFEFDFRTVNRYTPRFEMDTGSMGGGSPAPSSQPVTDPGQSNSQGTPEATPPTPMPTWGLPKNPENQAPALVNPLLADVPAPNNPAEPVGPEVLDWGGRKVEVKDPIIKDLHKDYTNLQAKYTQDSQQLSEARSQLDQANQMLQKFMELSGNPQGQPPGQAQPPAEVQPSPEDMEAAKTAFFDEFYENPEGALDKFVKKIVETTVQPVIAPIQQEREQATKQNEWNQAVQAAAAKHTDFADYVPHMEAVLENMPGVREMGVDTVYYLAKGMAAQLQTPAPTPEQMVADPAFLEQHVFGNEQIRNHFVNQYVSGVQTRQNQTPPVIGNQPGGQPPALPENQPRSIAEAGKALRKNWGLR